ncbi:MAG: 4Fe-4S binding protein [Lachnospiraceae bacterium]|nr:4Fe-4S binding protein [Lachnospiraceae bacterium]
MDGGTGIVKQEHCLHCGNCYEVCPVKAVEKRG